jgi:beta-glucosidase
MERMGIGECGGAGADSQRPAGLAAQLASDKKQAEDPENYVSGKAIDHFHRYEQDFDVAKKMQLNSFRFSIEWSRLEPELGRWDEAAFRHYQKYIAALKERGIEPVVTLWHYTVPTWFAKRGGFERRDNLPYFERFVERVAESFGDKITYVITMNEPKWYVFQSYMSGEWPPQKTGKMLAYNVYRNLAKVHAQAYATLKKQYPALHVGIAAGPIDNNKPRRPGSAIDALGVRRKNYLESWWFLQRIKRHQDFVGVNYYHTNYCRGLRAKTDNPDVPVSDMGWHLEPEGLYPVLREVWRRYQKPVIVTENGLADVDDELRIWWLEQTMIAMRRALADGVDLRGYLHWSLLNNFEWRHGWWPKFGLIAVDRNNMMKRQLRPSAKWLANYIYRQNVPNRQEKFMARATKKLASRTNDSKQQPKKSEKNEEPHAQKPRRIQ